MQDGNADDEGERGDQPKRPAAHPSVPQRQCIPFQHHSPFRLHEYQSDFIFPILECQAPLTPPRRPYLYFVLINRVLIQLAMDNMHRPSYT